MVLDTSAILAILLNEPEIEAFALAIERDPVRLLSAATYVEAAVVVEARFGDPGGRELDLLLETAAVEVVAFDVTQAKAARQAYRLYGKGRHPAALNFGDCLSYALAQTSQEPLLFKGDDFVKTDVRRVVLGGK